MLRMSPVRQMLRAATRVLAFWASATAARAEDLVIVAQPRTGVVAGQELKFKPASLMRREGPVPTLGIFSHDKPRVVVGKSAGDAPVLQEPKSYTTVHSIAGRVNGETKDHRIDYNDVLSVVPVSLWYRADTGGKPQLLGQTITWGSAEVAERLGGSSAEKPTYRITNETEQQTRARATLAALEQLPNVLSQAVAPSVIAGKARPPNITSEALLAQAGRNAQPYLPKTPQGDRKSLRSRASSRSSAWSGASPRTRRGRW